MAIALGTYVAGTVFALEAGTALFLLTAGATVVATAWGLSRVINGNQNKGPNAAAGSQGGRIQVPPATNNKIPVVYGNAFVNGIITDARLKSLGGENNDTMYYCIVLSEVCNDASAVYDIDDIYWNDLRLVPVDSGARSHEIKQGRKNVDNPDGVTEDFEDNMFLLDDKSFVEVRVYAGGSTALDQIWPAQSTGNTENAYTFWANNDGSWTSAYEMKGLVFAIVKLTYGGEKGFTGLANMTFRVDNTINNPADVWYDYMTSQRYGAGVETSAIDTTPSTSAWAQWKAYCNDSITYTPVGGGSTTQPRYRINGIIDTAQQVKSNIDSILQNGGAWMSYNVATGLWLPIPKRAATSGELAAALQFSDDNIISGITMGSTRLEDLYNKFEVEFYNKYNKDQRAYARLDLPAALRNANEPDNQLRMSLDFVNNSVQAELIGQLELRQSRDDIVVEFDTNHYGIQAQAGDVIAVTNSLYGWAPKYFRVMRVKEIEGEDGSLTAHIQAVEYNPDAYTVEPITEFTTIANIGIGNLVSSVGLPSPNNPTITDVRADASIPNFTFNVVIPTTGGPFDEIEVYFTEGWDTNSVTGSIVPGTGSNGVPVGKGLMTVTAVTYNSINPGDYFDLGGVTVESQLTQTAITAKTYSSGGAVGTKTFTLNNVTGVVIGQKPTGTGIPTGAMVVGVSGTTVTLDKAFTVQATGTYNFTTAGGTGTYQVSISTTTSGTDDLFDQPLETDFVYLKKITPPGNASNFETGATISTVITELAANSFTFRRYFLKARLGVKNNFGAFTNNAPVALDGTVRWTPNPVAAGKLTDLSDVLITSPTEGETLYYDTASNQWKNNSILKINDSATGVEIYNTAGTRVRRTETTTNTTITALTVSGATTGTTAAGFGTAIALENEISPDTYTVGAYITSKLTDVTPGSEDADLTFILQTGGGNTTPLRLTGSNAVIEGDLTVSGTNINTGATNTIIEIDRTTTGTTGSARALILQSTSTGTPTVGFGTALEFSAQTGASNFERAAYIDVRSTDITLGSEDFSMNFALMSGGTTYTDKLSLLSDGNLVVVPGYNNTTTPIGIQGPIAASDFWFVGGNDPSGTGSNNGAMIIASGNNGNEPIYVRQYTGGSITLPFPGTNTVQRELTLLDANGNTKLPGTLTLEGSISGSITLSAGASPTTTTYILPNADGSNGQVLRTNGSGTLSWYFAAGDVTGPASATDNAVVRFDSTTGKLIKNSGVIINNANDITGVAALTMSGDLAVNGGDITTTSTTANIVTQTATTINMGTIGATTINIGNSSSDINLKGNAIVEDSLIVTGNSIKSGGTGNPTAIQLADTDVNVRGQLTLNGNRLNNNVGYECITTGGGGFPTITFPTVMTTTPNLTLGNALKINGTTSGYSQFQAATTGANLAYVLPSAYPTTNGQVLASTTTGTMSWTTASGGSAIPITNSGTLSGTQAYSLGPGVMATGATFATQSTILAQTIRYQPIYVSQACTLSEIAVWQQTGTSLANCTAMVYIENCSPNSSTGWQPTSHLSGGYCGEITFSTIASPTLKSITGLSITLQPGAYLIAIQISNYTGTLGLRYLAGQVAIGGGYVFDLASGTTTAQTSFGRESVAYVSGTPATVANFTNIVPNNLIGQSYIVMSKFAKI